MRMTLAEFIRNDGHEVSAAEGAAEVLQLLAEDEPTVVLRNGEFTFQDQTR